MWTAGQYHIFSELYIFRDSICIFNKVKLTDIKRNKIKAYNPKYNSLFTMPSPSKKPNRFQCYFYHTSIIKKVHPLMFLGNKFNSKIPNATRVFIQNNQTKTY